MSEDYFIWLGKLKHQLNSIDEGKWDCEDIKNTLNTIQCIMMLEDSKK